jgi:SNF2 family DNA or RNA helicase
MATSSQSVTALKKQFKSSKKHWEPHPYQKKAVKFLLANANAGLLLTPGLGKTSSTYAALKTLQNKGMFKGALVIAPLRPVYLVWPKERDKWEEFKNFSVGILHGEKRDEVLREQHDIYVMNFENIEWLFGAPEPVWKNITDPEERTRKQAKYKADKRAVSDRLRILFTKVDTLVVDELSKMKHVDTVRFKSIKKYLGRFARRWGLTGSPASNGLMDLFGQTYVLDMGRALGQYITHYRNKYFYPSGFGGYNWKLQEGADKQIYQAIKPLMLTMQGEDYVKMPKLIPVTVYVDLPPAARKAYDTMEEDLFAEMAGENFIAMTASSASMKCEQLANGALYKDKVDALTGLPIRGKREWTEFHKAKLDAMQELIEELQGQPCLWGYHFGHDLERIVKCLGKDTPRMDVSEAKADKLVSAWNRGELPYLFGHPASMGHGLNMQEGQAKHVALFSVPWDYELYDQLIRRVRRQGNDAETVFVYHIVARNTIDEAKMNALRSKAAGQQAVFDALKSYYRSRRSLEK